MNAHIPYNTSATQRTVFAALLSARRQFGGATPALVDGDGRILTYDAILRAAFALGHALKKGTRRGEAVGVLLPTGAGAAIAFLAISAYGRVPAMLNFTSGAANLQSAVKTAQVTRIVTSATGKLSFAFFFGLALALWSANAGVKAIIDALNIV